MSRLALPVLLLALALVACTSSEGPGAQAPTTLTTAPPPPPPPKRDAAELARAAVGAKIGVLIHMDRVRAHPLAPRLAKMGAWASLFEGTGIDPLRDVDRAFVASANARDGKKVMVVAEHGVAPERIKSAMQILVDRSGEEGGWLEGAGVPAAKISVRGKQSVVLAVSDTLLVVTSEPLAQAAMGLASSGGLPEPSDEAAVVARVLDPSDALNAGRMPPIPETISESTARIRLLADGGANVAIDGKSQNPEQAEADAKTLTKSIDDATSVKVSVVRIRMFEPVKFHAEGSHIKANRALSRSDLERLLGLLETFGPRD